MMNIKLSFFISVLTATSSTIYAQDYKSTLSYGIKAGATFAAITGLETTLFVEPFNLNYTLKKQPRFGWGTSMFLNYRFQPALALHTEIMYARQGSNVLFTDTLRHFNNDSVGYNYKMQFGYQYLNIAAIIRFYPWGNSDKELNGLSIGVGPQLGFNVASHNIVFRSWGKKLPDDIGTNLQMQQQLRNVLKGKTNFGFIVGLGYEFPDFGLTIDARYQMAITDAVETLANSYRFIENKNTHTAFQLSVGWDFSYFNTMNR